MVSNIFRIYGFDSIDHFEPIKIDDDIILQKIQANEDSMVIAIVHNYGNRWLEPPRKAKKQMNFQESPPDSLTDLIEIYQTELIILPDISTSENLTEQTESIVEENLTRLRIFLACYQLYQEDGPFLEGKDPALGYYRIMATMPNVFHNPATQFLLYEPLPNGNELWKEYRESPVEDFRSLPLEIKNKFIELLFLPKGYRATPPIPYAEEKIKKSKDYHKKVKDIITN